MDNVGSNNEIKGNDDDNIAINKDKTYARVVNRTYRDVKQEYVSEDEDVHMTNDANGDGDKAKWKVVRKMRWSANAETFTQQIPPLEKVENE